MKFSTTNSNTDEKTCSFCSKKLNYFIFGGRVKRKVMCLTTLLINSKFLDTTMTEFT